jgi:hypothetical protein
MNGRVEMEKFQQINLEDPFFNTLKQYSLLVKAIMLIIILY